jgi:SAM-dependent methyltransferase
MAKNTAPRFTAEFGTDGPIPADGRLDGAAFHSNHVPIHAALGDLLGSPENGRAENGPDGHILEIGSGTGQHAAALAAAFPAYIWWPSDPIARHVRSIDGWRSHSAMPNLRPGRLLDASADNWKLGGADGPPAADLAAILAINVFHISPLAVALGTFAAAGRHLSRSGRVIVYGPFRQDGQWSGGNEAFDQALRAEDPSWGVRDTVELDAAANRHKLALTHVVDMPKSNLILVFERP